MPLGSLVLVIFYTGGFIIYEEDFVAKNMKKVSTELQHSVSQKCTIIEGKLIETFFLFLHELTHILWNTLYMIKRNAFFHGETQSGIQVITNI